MVEWKRLGEFASLQKTKNKAHVTENAYSITQNGLVPTKSFFKEKTIITSSDTKGYYIVEKDWFVYSPSRIDVGSINYLRDEGPVIVSPIDVVFSIDKEQCLPPYLLSYFLSHNGKRDMLKNRQGVEGMGRRNLPFSAIENMIIPIPSIEEQERIVGILDTFTAAIDNLKKQIELRKKQYEKYRDELLDLEGKEGVEMVAMKDLFDIKNGYTPSKSHPEYWEGGSLPWFRMEDIRQNGRILSDSIQHITPLGLKKSGLFPANSIIVATTATIGEHALVIVDSLANQRFTFLTKCKSYDSKLNMKYMYYYMFLVDDWCKKNVNVSGFASVDMDKFKKLLIPIPTIDKQKHIVSILDTFESSISNLEQQLSLRQKQYEYYRNQLLTFE